MSESLRSVRNTDQFWNRRPDRRTALVTGATRGVGRALSNKLAANNFDLFIVGRSTSRYPHSSLSGTLEQTKEELIEKGAQCLSLRADLSEAADIDLVVGSVISASGRCDVIINNAVSSQIGYFETTGGAEWDRVFSVNVVAPMMLVRGLLNYMPRGSCVVNLSSGAATIDALPNIAYGASKAGLERATIGLSAELGNRGIAVNALRMDCAVDTESAIEYGRRYSEIIAERPAPRKREALPSSVFSNRFSADEFADIVLALIEQPSDYTGHIISTADAVNMKAAHEAGAVQL